MSSLPSSWCIGVTWPPSFSHVSSIKSISVGSASCYYGNTQMIDPTSTHHLVKIQPYFYCPGLACELHRGYWTHGMLGLQQNWHCWSLDKSLIQTVQFQNCRSTPNIQVASLYLKRGKLVVTIYIWQCFLGSLVIKCNWPLLSEGPKR